MQKQFIFTFLFLAISLVLPAQINNQKYRKLTEVEKRKLAKKDHSKLYGDIYTLCFFVDTQRDQWSEEEVAYYLGELENSQYWLMEEASVYGAEINFINDYFQTVEEVVEVPTVTSANSFRLLQEVMLQMSYKDYRDFLNFQQFDIEENKLSVLFFVKSNDRSHARNYSHKKNLDTAIIYAKSTFGRVTSHYTFSHELLHLFGAWDLYKGESQTLDQATKLKELFPNSIMINTWSNQENLEVDELTAFLVGWAEEVEEEYLDFRPDRVAAKKEMEALKQKKTKSTELKFSLKRKDKN